MGLSGPGVLGAGARLVDDDIDDAPVRPELDERLAPNGARAQVHRGLRGVDWVVVDLDDHVALAQAGAGGGGRGVDAGDDRAGDPLGEAEVAPGAGVDVADADAVQDSLVVGRGCRLAVPAASVAGGLDHGGRNDLLDLVVAKDVERHARGGGGLAHREAQAAGGGYRLPVYRLDDVPALD